MQQELQIQSMDSNIKVDLLFNKANILEAIADCKGRIADVGVEKLEAKTAIFDLKERQNHYHKLIKIGKYKKESMEQSISDMNVEMRRYEDHIIRFKEREKHFLNLIDMLNVKLKEAEKWA